MRLLELCTSPSPEEVVSCVVCFSVVMFPALRRDGDCLPRAALKGRARRFFNASELWTMCEDGSLSFSSLILICFFFSGGCFSFASEIYTD